MRRVLRVTFLLPGLTRIRCGLKRASVVLGPDTQPQRFPAAIGILNQVFFAVLSGSMTSTRPVLRLRVAVPVGHQVRLCCQVEPASCKTHPIVKVLSCGKPSGAVRKACCRVVSDQVAVPSRSRSGARRNSARMRSRSVAVYWVGAPPPCRGARASTPSRLQRATRSATASLDRRPPARAAAV